jgi:hypothetical protein
VSTPCTGVSRSSGQVFQGGGRGGMVTSLYMDAPLPSDQCDPARR